MELRKDGGKGGGGEGGERRTHRLRVEKKVRASSTRVSVRGGQTRFTRYCCKPQIR